jgi:hypothetical protein
VYAREVLRALVLVALAGSGQVGFTPNPSFTSLESATRYELAAVHSVVNDK